MFACSKTWTSHVFRDTEVQVNPISEWRFQFIAQIECWHCWLLAASHLPLNLYHKIFKQETASLTSCAWRVSCNMEGAQAVVRSYCSETIRSREGDKIGAIERNYYTLRSRKLSYTESWVINDLDDWPTHRLCCVLRDSLPVTHANYTPDELQQLITLW